LLGAVWLFYVLKQKIPSSQVAYLSVHEAKCYKSKDDNEAEGVLIQ
jgi:hypothetical protein